MRVDASLLREIQCNSQASCFQAGNCKCISAAHPALQLHISYPSLHNLALQEVTLSFNNVAKGSYQVLIHKTVLDCIPSSTLTTSITGTGLKDHVYGMYQEALYSQQTSISSAAFTVDGPSNVIFSCNRMPAGLDYVQLKKLQQGQEVVVSPQWQEVPGYSQAHSDYPSADTAVGCEESGDPLWLSLRLGRNMRPEVGKIGPHLQREFHYAEIHDMHEQRSTRSEYFDSPTLSGVMHPGILVNASDFEWVTTCLKDVHVLLKTAVPLGVCSETMWASRELGDTHAHVVYGARISFCGWDKPRRGICAMVTSGPQISLLPGKLAIYKNGLDAAVFTWGGDTTCKSGLDDRQPFQLLCFKHL